jgi:lysophospholipase
MGAYSCYSPAHGISHERGAIEEDQRWSTRLLQADLESLAKPGELSRIIRLPGEFGELRLAHASASRQPVRGTVVLLTGRAEFIEKHEETVADLCALGFTTAVVEWRGQGLSARHARWPQRGHVADFSHYLADLGLALTELASLGVPRPWIMLGHSMGGHIGLRWLGERPTEFAAAIMTAPMFGILLPNVPERIARLLGTAAVRLGAQHRYAPGQRDFRMAACRYERNPLTSCEVRFARYASLLANRPELALGGVTWGWLDAALRSIALTRTPGYLEAIPIPMLICVADQERIVSNRWIERFANRLPQATIARFDARHELLLEREHIRAAVLERIDLFLAGLGY